AGAIPRRKLTHAQALRGDLDEPRESRGRRLTRSASSIGMPASVARSNPRGAARSRIPAMGWLQRVLLIDDRKGWRERARESIVDLNDGIVSAAGIPGGFAAAGASTRALVFAGATVVLTGGVASPSGCFVAGGAPVGTSHPVGPPGP